MSAATQLSLKRLFLFSMVANTGFIFAGFSVNSYDGFFSVLFFVFIYLITMFFFFSFLYQFRDFHTSSLLRQISSLKGLVRYYPYTAFSFSFFLFSIGGVPPLVGFFSKFFILKAVLSVHYFILAFCLIAAGLLSLFYYLRLINYMLFTPFDQNAPLFLLPSSLWVSICQSAGLFFFVGFIICGSPLIIFLQRLSFSFFCFKLIMSQIDFSLTQFINYDAFTGFAANRSNAHLFKFLSFERRNLVFFRPYFMFFF